MVSLRLILSCLFLLSGIAGLIYEVVWAKHFSLFLGNTTQAHTIVLATFMGGLALGYFLFGRIVDRTRSALNLYGWMEIAIGLSGALFAPFLGWLGVLYVSVAGHFGLDSYLTLALKFALAVFLLLVPTTLMGGTLPVLSRFVVRSLSVVESEVGWLYCVNSLGAVIGSLLAGFFLIPRFGLNLSLVMAVLLNLLAGLVALAMRPWERREGIATGPQAGEGNREGVLYTPLQVRVAVVGIALSGVSALIYEIAWIRLLSLVLGSSAYSFSLMLAAFIAGIALGGFTVSRGWTAKYDPFILFGLAELGIAVSVVSTLPIYERLPYYFVLWANLFVRAPETFWLHELTKFFLCFSLMLLPTFFLGMTLPLVSQVCAQSFERLGQKIGDVFAANTLGTLVGAIAAGLWLLPVLGLKGLFEFGVSVNLAIAVFALGVFPGWTPGKKIFTLGCGSVLFVLYLYFFPAWDKGVLSSGVFREKRFYVGMSYEDFKRRYDEKVLYYKDGANMTVTVTEGKGRQLTLKVNGKADATSSGDLPTQILLGQVPFLLKPDARRVLVVGLGSGITAGSVLRHPVERLDLVEISQEVVEGNRFFAPHNYDVLKDARLRLYVEDAKTFLKIAPVGYDVIISEPSNPWIAGIGNLFSVEFYRDVRDRLGPEGLVVQWFHAYEMTDETVKLVLRTFVSSFEHVTLWAPMPGDFLLVGSKKPLPLDFANSRNRYESEKVREDLRRIGIEAFPTMLSLQVASDVGVRKAAGKGRLNEDLFPILEYDAPKAFFLGQASLLFNAHDERQYPRDGSPLYLTEYLKLHPLTVAERRNLALYHVNRDSAGRNGVVRAFVDLWLEKAPNDPEARWAMSRVHRQAGNLEGARRELNFVLKARPDHREYLEAAADLEFQIYLDNRSLLDAGRPDKALGYLSRALELEGDKKDKIYRKIAHIYESQRDYVAAIRFLERAAVYAQAGKGELRPGLLWLEAADLALEIDDLKAAKSLLEKALAQNPNNPEARRSLRRLLRQEG